MENFEYYKKEYKQTHLYANIQMIFQYKDNSEYRVVFREITRSNLGKSAFGAGGGDFQSDMNTPPENPYEIDDETLDENDYDESAVSVFLDAVYEKTKNHPLFQTVYDSAAAKMLSQDREIGLAILLSYDYLWAFYPCYCEYIDNPETFSKTNDWYIHLLEGLERKSKSKFA